MNLHVNERRWLTLTVGGLLMLMTWALPGSSTSDEEYLSAPFTLASKDTTGWQLAWQGAGGRVELLTGPGQEEGWLCPRSLFRKHQPFCRLFPARFLGACHHDGRLQMVLANGDIYRVDHALLATERHLGRVHHPDSPLELQHAWFPSAECFPEPGRSQVFAVDRSGVVLRFDGQRWMPNSAPSTALSDTHDSRRCCMPPVGAPETVDHDG